MRLSTWLWTVIGVAGTWMSASTSHAEQFTFFDMTYTATEQNSNTPARGHYDFKEGGQVKLTQPDNWTSPIDYTKGTVVIELEVMSKPSQEETQIDVCFLTSKGYGCRNTPKYTKPGRYQLIRPMPTGFYAFDRIDWTKKITHVQLVTKDGANNNGGRDLKQFFPHTSRIAISFVSPGGTYVMPPGWTAAPGTDGGATSTDDAGASDGATMADAGSNPGMGGSGGSNGGAGGSSGAAGSSGGSSGGSGGSSGSAGSSAGSAGATGGSTTPGSTGGSQGAGGSRPPTSTPPTPTSPDPKPGSSGSCAVAVDHQSQVPAVWLVFGLLGACLAWRRRDRR